MQQRIQLSRRKGWRMPAGAVNVARPSRWGNPFNAKEFGQAEAVRLFRGIVDGGWSPDLVAAFNDRTARQVYEARCEWLRRIGGSPLERIRCELRGNHLACWCAPGLSCHADVLLEIANR